MIFRILFCSLFLISCTTAQKMGSTESLRSHVSFKLSNGLEVLTIEDRALPYIDVALLVGVGTSSEQEKSRGLTGLVGDLLTSGTKGKTKEEVVNAFALLGTELSVGVTKDYTLLGASSLSSDQVRLYSILSEVISESSFKTDEVFKSKTKIISEIEKMPDDARSFSKKLFDEFLFDKSSYAYNVLGTKDGLENLSVEQVRSFFKKYFIPSNCVLVVVGNFGSNLVANLEKTFGVWSLDTETKAKLVRTTSSDQLDKHKVRLVGRDDLVQAQLKIGSLGVDRSSDDYLKLQVAGTILGKGFSSRLMERIRNQLGLTYYISSSFDSFMYAGSFMVDTFTKNATVRKAIDEILLILDDFHTNGVTSAELQMAKDYLVGSFPSKLDTAIKQGLILADLKFYDIDHSYLTDYVANVRAISLEEINSAIKRTLNPKKLKILVYGGIDGVEDQLKGIGTLEVRPL